MTLGEIFYRPATAAREVRAVRAEALRNLKGGLRALYRTLELPGANPLKDAHAALAAAVLAAYGFSAKNDLLAQLLALNLEVASKIEKGEPVTAPGVPKNYPDPMKPRIISELCKSLIYRHDFEKVGEAILAEWCGSSEKFPQGVRLADTFTDS